MSTLAYVSAERQAPSRELAVIIGVGGGGDIASTVLLDEYVLHVYGARRRLHGSLLWDSWVLTRRAEPWRLDEIEGILVLHRWAGLVDERSRAGGVHELNAMRFARAFGEQVLVIDVYGGAEGVAEALASVRDKLGARVIVGVDVGGDVLARPEDKDTLRSPLMDSLMLAALAKVGGLIAIVCPGADGEIPHPRLRERLLEAARRGALVDDFVPSAEALERLEHAVEAVITSDSRRALEILRRRREAPEWARKVYIFEAAALLEMCPVAKAVSATRSLEEAERIIRELGLPSDIDVVRRQLEAEGR